MSSLQSCWGLLLRSGHRRLFSPLFRSLSCHRAAVTKVHRETYLRTYPTVLVLPDGATINIRYHLPRKIIKLPIDLHNCSKEDLRRIKHLRRPRDKIEAEEEITTTFDPLRYLSKS